MVLVKILIVASLFAVTCIPDIQGADATNYCVYYVSSVPRIECMPFNISEKCLCKTIDEYALNGELEDQSDVMMIFFPGVHNVTENLNIDDNANVTMIGPTSQDKKYLRAVLLLNQGNIEIQYATDFKLSRLSIVGFSRHFISIRSVLNVIFEDVVINGSAVIIRCLKCNTVIILDIHFIGSVLAIARSEFFRPFETLAYNSVVINDTVFQLPPEGNGLSCCNVYSLAINNISVSNLPSNCTTKPPKISLKKCSAFFQWAYIRLYTCDLLTKNIDKLVIFNSTIKRSFGTGLCVRLPTNATAMIIHSSIRDHMKGGVMFWYTGYRVQVKLLNSTISNNSNTLLGSAMGSALSVYTRKVCDIAKNEICTLHTNAKSVLSMVRTGISNNRHLVSQHISTVTLFSFGYLTAIVQDSNFTCNYGSAITAYSTSLNHNYNILITFLGDILFRKNTAYRGGAIHLFQSKIGINKSVNITFEGNIAKDVGGAIYVYSSQRYSHYYGNDYDVKFDDNNECFYELIQCSYGIQDFIVYFHKNSAKNGGEHIFGASVISTCNFCPERKVSEVITVSPYFQFYKPEINSFSPISSHPSRVCLCEDKSVLYSPRRFCTNVSQIFLSRSVYPGEEFSFEAVLVGAEFGTVTGSVYAQFLTQSDSVLYPPHQYSQRIDDFRKCKQLSYTVYSSNSHEILTLTSSDATVINYGDQEIIESEARNYDRDIWRNVASSGLLTTPVYINLTILPCPQGFKLVGKPEKCNCAPALVANHIFCNFTNGIGHIYRNGTQWVGMFNEGSITIQKRCPFDYCLTRLTGVDLRHSDTQCAMNHAGILCGGCRKRFSLALGTNMCLSCSGNKNLGLLLFFLLAGILLVVFIKVLNMTVSQGTINGLVFYANVIWAYQYVFFPKNISNTWFSLMRVFIAWLNLDFGIETCFVEGLTGYVKTWLQFTFPLYIWGIAGAMVVLAHYSKKMTKLFGKNCVQVLATLFLLSYAKLFRTIITAMVPAVIEVYPQSSDRRSGSIIVWAFDGNLSYGENPHGFLFVAALSTLMLLWLPYTMVLLLYRLLMKKSSLKCFRCLIKLVPLIETYFGPLKIAHYYWVGVLLLVRGILLVIFTLTYTTTPTASLLGLVIVLSLLLVFLAYTGRMYKNKLLSLLELSFLLNLQVLGVSVLFIDVELSNASKEVVVDISVSIAFIQFLGIISFHVYQLIHKAVKPHCCSVKNENSKTTESVPASNRYHLMEGELVNDLVKRELIELQYLEDYAENADSRK